MAALISLRLLLFVEFVGIGSGMDSKFFRWFLTYTCF